MNFADIRPGDFVHVRVPVTEADSESVVVTFHGAEFLIERSRIVGHEPVIKIGERVEIAAAKITSARCEAIHGVLLGLHGPHVWVDVTEPELGPRTYILDGQTLMRRSAIVEAPRAADSHGSCGDG